MGFLTPCPIWAINVEMSESQGDFVSVNSPRAGGKYSVSGSVGARVRILLPRQKALLTSWIVEQHRSGIEIPQVNSANLDNILSRQPMNFSEKITRVLKYCENNISKIGGSLSFNLSEDEDDDDTYQLMALTECQDKEELSQLLLLLGKTGLISDDSGLGFGEICPSVDGWLRLEELQRSQPDTSQAFVAMWFHPRTETAYKDGISAAISACGYKPLRIDNKQHVNKIDDEIISEIRRSRFVVADFTCEPEKPRGGVYFEAGFAMALGIPVIWTCKDTSISDLHFDTRQYNHIAWQAPHDLYKQLKARIGAVIGDGPLQKFTS